MRPGDTTSMDVTTVILCGGEGSRLGYLPKGLLGLEGRPVIERLLAEAPPGPVWISTNRPEPYDYLDVPLVGDVVPGAGAPGGVFTALCVSVTPWVLVVACDMPGVRRDAFERLLARRRDEVDAVCFERDGDLEPLCALYHRRLLPRLERELPSGPSLRGVLRSVSLALIAAPDGWKLDSLNTPGDLSRHGISVPPWARPPRGGEVGVGQRALLR